MTHLLILSLGSLSGALLEACARRSVFERITLATRNVKRAQSKANNVRLGAGLEARYPHIAVEHFDMHAADAASRLCDFDADVTFAAPSMLPWWRLNQLGGHADRRQLTAREQVLASAPFATFMACHLAPMLALRAAWVASGHRGAWVAASYPDVVNHVLACSGVAPTCGSGNLAEIIPKLRLLLGRELDRPPNSFEIKLVAQHAFEYFCLAEQEPDDPPPFLLQALLDGRDVSGAARDLVFEPWPIPFGLDLNRITASASLQVVEGLCSDTPIATHVPAPAGRLGGYPVLLSRRGVFLDLPPSWGEENALAVNRESLPYDGIDGIDDDGCVFFSAPTQAALKTILGRRIDRMRIEHAAPLADEITAAVASF